MNAPTEILMVIGAIVVLGAIIYWRKNRKTGPRGTGGGTKPGDRPRQQ